MSGPEVIARAKMQVKARDYLEALGLERQSFEFVLGSFESRVVRAVATRAAGIV